MCIELRGEYVEQIPSLVAVACFLPGRAKDLSAPPRTCTFSCVKCCLGSYFYIKPDDWGLPSKDERVVDC
jgi:hypothetical protein